MLRLFRDRSGDCEARSRRTFLLELGSLSGLGLSLPTLLARRAEAASAGGKSKDVSCILIWTRGGTSHHDTLDPKPNAAPEVRGEFGVIGTAVPGVQFAETMPTFARELSRYSLLRGLNPRNGSHGTADAIMMSGHRFNPAVTYPCFGSVVARERNSRNHLPAFVQVGTDVDRRFGGGVAGYLGIAFNPFELPGDPNNPAFTVRDVTPPGGISLARVDRRREALASIDRLQRGLEHQAAAFGAMDKYYEAAFSMVTSPGTQRAFDLVREDPRVRDRYGRTTLGQGCLIARRLVEAGVRFVTVTSGGWDTHQDNFKTLKNRLLPPLDQAFPTLLADLDARGLLESTLVVWMTDFGRTPKINSAAGRDHWSTAGILCMAGADTPRGRVVGRTDAEGGRVVEAEYFPEDVAATIYTKLGIPLDTIHTTPDGRPMRLCDGRVIKELMT